MFFRSITLGAAFAVGRQDFVLRVAVFNGGQVARLHGAVRIPAVRCLATCKCISYGVWVGRGGILLAHYQGVPVCFEAIVVSVVLCLCCVFKILLLHACFARVPASPLFNMQSAPRLLKIASLLLSCASAQQAGKLNSNDSMPFPVGECRVQGRWHLQDQHKDKVGFGFQLAVDPRG